MASRYPILRLFPLLLGGLRGGKSRVAITPLSLGSPLDFSLGVDQTPSLPPPIFVLYKFLPAEEVVVKEEEVEKEQRVGESKKGEKRTHALTSAAGPL